MRIVPRRTLSPRGPLTIHMLICRPNLPLRLTCSHRPGDTLCTSRLYARPAEIDSVVAVGLLIGVRGGAGKAKLWRMRYAFMAR